MPTVRRLGLVGGECSGKSALAAALAAALPACTVDESLRDFVEREARPPAREEQEPLMREQERREDAAAAACPHPWLVADPAPLMTAVYSLLYYDDPSLLAAALEHATGYDLVVWCAPDIPWTADGLMRDGAAWRAEADAIIGSQVAGELMRRGIAVVRAEGDVYHRVASVEEGVATLTT
jgi:nicotinamide riboside kinase